MRRYVPKTYNNRRLLRIVYRTIVTVSIIALVLFISLFFGLQNYMVMGDNGAMRLEIPWLIEE